MSDSTVARRTQVKWGPEPKRDKVHLAMAQPHNALTHFMFNSQFEFAEKVRKAREGLFETNLVKWREFVPGPQIGELEEQQREELEISSVTIPPSTKKEKIQYFKFEDFKQALVASHLLTPTECQQIIDGVNNVGLMTSQEIVALNFPEYFPADAKKQKNTSNIALVEDVALAQKLWSRLERQLTQHCPGLKLYVRQQGGDEAPLNEHYLRPVGVCPLMRVLKYTAGQEFHAHADGVDYSTVNVCGPSASGAQRYRSLLTLAIYLNDAGQDFEGGSLEFVQPPELKRQRLSQEQKWKANVSSLQKVYDPYNIPVVIEPCKGTGVIFHQAEHHEAKPLEKGIKYMIQTSIMFELPL